MTSRLRPSAPAAALAAALALAGGCRSAPTPSEPGARPSPAVSAAPGARPGARRADPDGPVTHVGRTVFPRCHAMVVARVRDVARTSTGSEVVRVDEEERLWGPPEPADGPFGVVCGERGLAPGPGGRAIFLLRLLPQGAYEALEVAPLDDLAGPARLTAFRKVLEIEAMPDPSARREAMLAYLRSSATGGDAWTRANAVREYAAFADVFPEALGPDDARALTSVLPVLGETELRRLAQFALDRVPSARAATASTTRATAAPADPLAPYTQRFDAAKDAAARREAVLDAAANLDRASERLVARGLKDGDASVREASVAAAGQIGMESFVPALVSLVGADPSPEVRRTSVLALGHLRAAAAVPALAGLARGDRSLAREALFALARIRDDAALARLGELGRDGDEEVRKLVAFLVSEDFVRQEKAMGATWPNR